ncbi:MAG: hypothetical protein AB7V22_10735 [Kiritimatiellia bacterium]
MAIRRGSRWTAALGGAAALFLLAVPLRMEPLGAMGRALGGAGHVALWAGLAWLAGRALPPNRRGWPLGIALAALAGLAEGLQSFAGRTPEWTDWLYGLGGAAIVCATWNRGGIRRWAGVLALAAFPAAWEIAMDRQEAHAFPVLARPGSLWAGRGWELNGVKLSAARKGSFNLAPDPESEAGAYPGLFRPPVCRDWRGLRALTAELFWPMAVPAVFAVRIDDRPGNPPYADRFQKEFAVTPGWNAVRIPAAEIARTAGGRPLRLDDVRLWGVFLVSDVPFDYFYLGPVGLDMQEEMP